MARSRLRFATVVLGLVPGAVACTGILGLSDYEKVECTPGQCVDGGGIDGSLPVRDAEAGVLDASGTGPVQWPQFRMPNYPQDGGPDANIVTYTSDNDTVRDNVSKLVWRKVASPSELTFAEAGPFCQSLPGFDRWRLPSRIELVTLLDFSANLAISAVFPSTAPNPHWTQSEVRPYAGSRWTVTFGSGAGPKPALETTRARVRCVKDVQ